MALHRWTAPKDQISRVYLPSANGSERRGVYLIRAALDRNTIFRAGMQTRVIVSAQ
jgi:hypothetical protein